MSKVNYHDLLERALFNIAWEHGMDTLEVLLEDGQRPISAQESQVIEHILQNIFDHEDIA